MKKKKTVDYVECDACQYVINEGDYVIRLQIPTGPHANEEFHFHSISHKSRSDCLRYWFMNPYIITRSLRERGYTSPFIEHFLSVVSYRKKEAV